MGETWKGEYLRLKMMSSVFLFKMLAWMILRVLPEGSFTILFNRLSPFL